MEEITADIKFKLRKADNTKSKHDKETTFSTCMKKNDTSYLKTSFH